MNNNLAPIVLFVYNRPEHTRQTIEALQKNELAKESELFIYSDEAKNEDVRESVNTVREYIDKIDGFKKVTIIKRKKNLGLADSIINGVTKIVDEYGKIIVLEDDLITGSNFLKFMNDSLNIFEDREDIFSITGFNFPSKILKIPEDYDKDIYLSYRCMSWGWSTWKDRWSKIDWLVSDFENFSINNEKKKLFNRGGDDLFPMLKSQLEGNIDSWAIRFCYGHYQNNSFCVYPTISLINNEGFDGSGVHCGVDENKKFENILLNKSKISIDKDILPNQTIIDNFYKLNKQSLLRKIKNLIRSYI